MGHLVLIVEDDAALRSGMRMLLRAKGHTDVVTAGTLAEARECLRHDPPARAIVDLNLPDGLGTDLLRELRNQGSSLRVLMLTGSVDMSVADQAMALGAEGVLRKPPDWDALAAWATTPPGDP